MKNDTITVFTDGSSRGNPGPGGWGTIIIDNKIGKVWELGGKEENTTNNRMEMMAVQEALAFIEKRKIEGNIEIHTDSAYLLNGITGWVFGWEKNCWKTKTGEAVLNQDLWKEISAANFRLKLKRKVDWKKVDGHSGLRGNERVDKIATMKADGEQVLLFSGSLSNYEKLVGGNIFDVSSDPSASSGRAKKKSSSSKKAYSYVSMVNGKIEVCKDWATCEKRVKGKSGVKFKKVGSKEEEDSLIEEWRKQAKLHTH